MAFRELSIREIKQLREEDPKKSWQQIADALSTGRTAWACSRRFGRHLKMSEVHWTQEEDNLLLEKRSVGYKFSNIVSFFSGKSISDLRFRFNTLKNREVSRVATPAVENPEQATSAQETYDFNTLVNDIDLEENYRFFGSDDPFNDDLYLN